jgi:hypothetical protein
MSFDVQGHARLQSAPAPSAEQALPSRPARLYLWLATAGIGASLAVIMAVSLARGSWMGPPMPMPRVGPPFELGGWHLPLNDVAIALWLCAIAGGLGVAAGLIAIRRGARPPIRLLLLTAVAVIAILTVLPPVGSTDSLDYMAFGRMMALGHSPYVMVPWDLIRAHDPVAKSIPWEWGRYTTPYGPAATVEEFIAAKLGGTSAAQIVFWLKLANALAFGAIALIADRLLRHDPAARLRAHLLWTINPLLIWQVIAAAHLDVLAAAAGMLGLVIAGGWPTIPSLATTAATGRPPLGRVLAGGALIGLAADMKISFVLFGLGLAWALRRYPGSCLAAAFGMVAVLLPTYAWFGPPAIRAVLSRGNRTTADNFYQLFSSAQHGFLMQHVGIIAAIAVVGVAVVTLTRLPGRVNAQPAILSALALSIAWLFVWQYQLPSYDAMLLCLLILVPVGWLDWLVIIRLTAATIALMPGNPTPLQSHLLARIELSDITVAVPIVLLAAVVALILLCLFGPPRSRRSVLPPVAPAPEPLRRLTSGL